MISLLRSSGLCWRFERFADDLLGAAEPVNRRRIDEIYPAVERRMDRLNRFMLVCPTPHPTADRPGSKRDARHLEGVPAIEENSILISRISVLRATIPFLLRGPTLFGTYYCDDAKHTQAGYQ